MRVYLHTELDYIHQPKRFQHRYQIEQCTYPTHLSRSILQVEEEKDTKEVVVNVTTNRPRSS